MSNANGYVVYVNDIAYIVSGSDDISIALDGLIPGTTYSITVRAYEDILGPASTTLQFTSISGRFIIIEYSSTLYVGLQLKQNGRPYKAMVKTISKSWQEAFSKVQKLSSIHYHVFL